MHGLDHRFAIAYIPENGMLHLGVDRLNKAWKAVFHRGNTIDKFPVYVPELPFSEAKEEAEADECIMEFDAQGFCVGLWFTQAQIDEGVAKRLDRWKGCYGRYPVRVYARTYEPSYVF